MRIFYIQLITALSYLNNIQSIAPPLYGVGCGIMDGVLYNVGGKTFGKTRNATDDTPSKTVYSLDLKSGFELDSGLYAPWKPLAEDESPGAHIPGVVVHKPSKSIFMFGGEKVPFSSSFQVFNTVTKKWSLDTTAIKNFPDLTLSTGEKAKYSFYIGSFVADDMNENAFYQYGGQVNNNKLDGYQGFSDIFAYDAKSKTWSLPKPNLARVSGHTAQYYKGKMYVVGGMGFIELSLIPMDKVMVFDMSSLKWTNVTVKGDAPTPRFALSSVMVGSWMVILGGTENTKFNSFPSSDIFYLDLDDPDNLTWNKIRMDGFSPAAYGCLAYYNDHLIYSFGLRNDIISTTQIINIKSKELVKSLPAYKGKSSDPDKKDGSDNTTKDSSESELNLPAIIGGSVGGFVFLVIVCVGLWYCLRKRPEQKIDEKLDIQPNFTSSPMPALHQTHVDYYQPPNPIHANIWSDKPIDVAEPSFSLNTATVLPNFDDDLAMQHSDHNAHSTNFSSGSKTR